VPQETYEPRLAESLTPVATNGEPWFLPGSSPAMRGIQRVVTEIAPTDLPVLIAGEHGTGKEVLAVHIHRLSSRREQAFSKLTCAALSLETLQKFLVGSNGNGSHHGWNGGTLYLDEVADLDPACQSAVLEYLTAGEASQGGSAPSGRIICSTTQNLEERIRSGKFREELYFRINGVGLRLPPMRHRKEDIPTLLEFFLRKSAAYFGRPQPVLSPWATQVLQEYAWPGNVRELENVVRNIVALGDEELGLADLQRAGHALPPRDAGPTGTSLKEASRAASRRAERELMLKVLTRTHWNRKMASKELQISYKALLYKLKNLGLEDTAES
jgi:two-component system response regulator AtoC